MPRSLVSVIDAGPGDPELLAVKAAPRLSCEPARNGRVGRELPGQSDGQRRGVRERADAMGRDPARGVAADQDAVVHQFEIRPSIAGPPAVAHSGHEPPQAPAWLRPAGAAVNA